MRILQQASRSQKRPFVVVYTPDLVFGEKKKRDKLLYVVNLNSAVNDWLYVMQWENFKIANIRIGKGLSSSLMKFCLYKVFADKKKTGKAVYMCR